MRCYRGTMLDLLLIIVIIGFFAAASLLVRSCNRITQRDPGDRS